MRKTLLGYMERIDAASLREWVLIFAAGALLLIAVLNATLIEPELAKQKRLSRQVAQNQAQIAEMQVQMQKLAQLRQGDPDSAQRRQLEDMRKRVAASERQLLEMQRKLVAPDQIGKLLEEMLSRNRRLQLVDMRTLPVSLLGGGSVVTKPAAEAKPAPGGTPGKPAADAPPGGQIYRHGVEITVSGTYLDLLDYLKDLEKLPSQLYWGKLDFMATPNPKGGTTVTLKLAVHTLSLDLAWLVV